MKVWLKRLLGKKTQQTFPEVWDQQLPSIYARLERTYDQQQPLAWDNMLLESQPLSDSGEVFWAPGAMEGTMMYHFGVGSEGPNAAQILAALQMAIAKPGVKTMQTLYSLINQDSPLHYIDELLNAIPGTRELRADRLNELALMLCTQSPDRHAVKFAMGIMAFFPNQRSVEVLRVLARHDEFTLYAVVALRSMVEPEQYADIWFSMAQRVNGWGRIHLMERIPEMLNETMSGWLLREGFFNSVMNEYTAVNSAVRGGLADALATEHDDELLLGAAEMLFALLNEGPVPGMSVYSDGEVSSLRYLQNVLEHQPAHPLHYLTAQRIGEWAQSEEYSDATYSLQLRTLSAEIAALPIWNDVTEWYLAGEEGYAFNLAIEVCRDRQVDPFATLYARQRDKPQAALWYQLMKTENADQAYLVCRLAEAQFDLKAMASGAMLSSGMGPEWNTERQLDSVLQELKRFPEMGWPLLESALQSPVVRNRQMAINALETWPPESLSVHRQYIEHCARHEPHGDVQQQLKSLLERIK